MWPRDFVGVIKGEVLSWEDCPGLTSGHVSHQGPRKKKGHSNREGGGRIDAEVGMIGF